MLAAAGEVRYVLHVEMFARRFWDLDWRIGRSYNLIIHNNGVIFAGICRSAKGEQPEQRRSDARQMALRASARPPNRAEATEVSTKPLWPPLACAPLVLVQPSPVCKLQLEPDRRSHAIKAEHIQGLAFRLPVSAAALMLWSLLCCFPSSMSLHLRAQSWGCADSVRVQSRYAELLKEIRMGRVRKVMYFGNDESAVNVEEYQEVEGPCLVVFNDNQVAHSYVPRFDYRIP